MNLQILLNQNSQEINESLKNWLNHNQMADAKLHDALSYALMAKGKRLRGFLVRQSSLLCSQTCETTEPPDEKAIMVVAMAIEMVHCYSLAHDDLPAMDDDDLRRGQASLHKKFDEATAILAGDALLTSSFQLLSQWGNLSDLTRMRLIAGLATASGGQGMVAGQMMDLFPNPDSQNQAEYLKKMHSLKTGELIRFSAQTGAILFKTDETFMIGYGEWLGRLFQITDDLLDYYGNADLMGKLAGKDIEAGKLNALSLLGVEGAEKQADEALEATLTALDYYPQSATQTLRELALYVRHRKA